MLEGVEELLKDYERGYEEQPNEKTRNSESFENSLRL
jgi:hypothetical protein